MSADKVREAIALIKAGDKKAGRDLLVDVVNADPRNEVAWLWLATLVPPEKRVFCLEKALSINPNNAQARQYLEKIRAQAPAAQEPASQPVAAEGRPVGAPAESGPAREVKIQAPAPVVSGAPEVWTVPFGNKLASVIVLDATRLITFDTAPAAAAAILESARLGSPTRDWSAQNLKGTANYKSIEFSQMLRVREILEEVTITYRDNSQRESSVKLICRKDEVARAILEALHQRLGSQFSRTSQAISRTEVAWRSLLPLILALGATGFCYWATLDLMGREVHGRGSGIASLFQLIGPNGVLCIGGVLLLLIFISMIRRFMQPPAETLLIRRA